MLMLFVLLYVYIQASDLSGWWMENFVLPHMPVSGIYIIYIYIYNYVPYVQPSRECTEDFTDWTSKRKWWSWKTCHSTPDSAMMQPKIYNMVRDSKVLTGHGLHGYSESKPTLFNFMLGQ